VKDLELCRLSVAAVSRALHAREFSSLELTDAYLNRIEQLDPRINAYITVTAERARTDARRATEELAAGRSRGPLHGVPVALKDLYETAGIRTTGGGKIHSDHVPAADCTAARKLRDAGTILLGKLNTHEYAYGGPLTIRTTVPRAIRGASSTFPVDRAAVPEPPSQPASQPQRWAPIPAAASACLLPSAAWSG